MDFAGDIYIKYYEAQAGGSIPVFSGSRRYHPQSGAGLGDILQGIFRTVVPVALNGVGTFVDKITKSHVSDSILKNAAKAALGSTAKTILTDTSDAITSAFPKQRGKGRRRLTTKAQPRSPLQKGRGQKNKRNSKAYNTRSRARKGSVKSPVRRTRRLTYKNGRNAKKNKFSDSISGLKFNF